MNTTLTIRGDRDLKDQADEILRALGLNFNTAVNAFLSTVVRTQGIPQPQDLSSLPNRTTLAAIEEGEKLLQDPTTPRYNDMANLKAALKSSEPASFFKW